MSLLNNKRREEVETTIRSCLVARQGDVTIQQLDSDFTEFEGEHIPYKEFGYHSLHSFLKQLHNVLWLDERSSGFCYVKAIDSEKSRHVSSLVEGQRRSRSQRFPTRRSQRPYCGFPGGRPQVSINSRCLMHLIREVNTYPDGINLDSAIQYVNKVSRPVEITRNELERQLRAVQHKVAIGDNKLYPANRTGGSSRFNNTYIPPPRLRASHQSSSNGSYSRPLQRVEAMAELTSSVKKDLPIRFTGEDDEAIDADDIVPKYPSGYTPASEPPRRNGYRDQEPSGQNYESRNSYKERENNLHKEREHRNEDYREQNSHGNQNSYRETSNHPRDSTVTKNSSKDHQNSRVDQYDDTKYSEDKNHYEESRVPEDNYNGEDYGEDDDFVVNDDEFLEEDYAEDRSALINDKIRARLEILIRNNPDGIWCADLPQKYLEKFCIPLNYLELGFNSVCEFAAQLPTIFHCVRPSILGDYKLYNAKAPAPDLRNGEPQTRETLASKYSIYDDGQDDPEVFPGRLDPSTTMKLFPEGAMELGETVGHISVTELGKELDYEEVEVSEVFTPSFFWIQLRRKKPKFKKFMYELHAFYEANKSKFRIPLIMLEKGLNVACIYDHKWHRGIIKTVLPDGRSTVHFYDYGTVKSYVPEGLYFLHRQFSYLPAQAIPCGLFNVRPYETDKWTKQITWEFVTKTSVPLVATIGARNEEENSLLVSLTDTRADEDFHINDWMYLKKYAQQGRMVRIRNRNFAFSHYRECLERKDYDPNAIHEFYVEYDDSDLSDSKDDNNAKKKLAVDPVSRENQSSEDSHIDPFFPVSRENPPINENRNSQQPSDLREVPERNDANVLKTRSRNTHQQSTNRECKFLKSDRLAENNPEELSPEISVVNGVNRVRKRSTHRVYKFLKSDRVETKTVKTEVAEIKPLETEVVEVKPVESEIVEMKTAVPEILETKPVETKSVTGRYWMLQRIKASLAKSEAEKSSSTPEKDTSCSSGYNNNSESPETGFSSKSISSGVSESKIEKLRRFMMKSQASDSTNSLEKRDRRTPIRKLVLDVNILKNSQLQAEEHNLGSKNQIESQSPSARCNLESKDHEIPAPVQELKSEAADHVKNPPKSESPQVPKHDSPLTTESDSDSIPVRSPLLMKENSEEKKERTFFGTITSECGGSGRMEPMDWTAIRTALEESEGQFSTLKSRRSVDLSTKLSKGDLPRIDANTMFIVDNYPNSGLYERDVKWLPAGNVRYSRTSVSPLLKLKQRLLANSYKKSAVLISSKMLSILKGELENVYEDDETACFVNGDESSDLEKFAEGEKIDEAEKLDEVERAVEVEKPEEVEKTGEIEKPSEVATTVEVEKAEEPNSMDEVEEEEKRRKEEINKKVQAYLEAHKLRGYQDPYSSLVHVNENEAKPEFKNAEVSSLIKGFVVKNIEFRAKMAEFAVELPPEPKVTTKKKKRKSRKWRKSMSVTPDLPTSSAEGENESGEKGESNSPEEGEKSSDQGGKPKLPGKKKKKWKSKVKRSASASSGLLTSSTEEANDPVEKKEPKLEKDEGPELIETGESKSLEKEERKLSTLDDVSSILSNDVADENSKLDSAILTNGSVQEKYPSNLVDEKDHVSDLINVEEEEEELLKLVNSSLELCNNFMEKGQSILNVVGCLPVNVPKTNIFERLNNMNNNTGSIESLDSDDLSSSDEEEDEDLIKECRTVLIHAPSAECSKQGTDQTSEAKTENPSKNLEFSKEKILPQALPETKDLKDDKNLIYEEILLNPNQNKINTEALAPLVFNDVDITSGDDDEQWDVMSYMSDQSHLADPCNRLAKNYRKYNQMIKDNLSLKIEEIPNNEINSKNESKTNGEPKHNGISNTKNSTTDKPSNGIVPPNFKYPDEMKLPRSTEDPLISRSSSLGLLKNSVNVNKQAFVNFQYTQEMKSRKGNNSEIESSSAESETNLKADSPIQMYEDFMINSTANSTPDFEKYEPPGKSKSLKNMLLKMKKK